MISFSPTLTMRTNEVDRSFPNSKDRSLAVNLELMPERRAHSCEQFVHSEWLGHVVVRAGIEGLDLASFIAAAGQHHDWNALIPRTDYSQ